MRTRTDVVCASLEERRRMGEISLLVNRSEALLSEGKLENAAELARDALAKMRGEGKSDLKGKAERVIEAVEVKTANIIVVRSFSHCCS